MANPAGEIGQLRDEELPVVRVIVPPDPSGRVFEDEPEPGDLVFGLAVVMTAMAPSSA